MSVLQTPPSGSADATSAVTIDDLVGHVGPDERGVSLWRGAWHRLRRNPTAIFGALIVSVFILVAVFAPLIAPYEPGGAQWNNQITPSSVPGPSDEHLLGLDSFGSDLFTQLVFGARKSLIIGVVSTALGLTAGAALGLLAGAIGGVVDTIAMRFVDIMLSIPSLLLAVSVAAVVGRKPIALMIAIGVVQIPIFARLLRGSLLQQTARGLRPGGVVPRAAPTHGGDEPHAAELAGPVDRPGHAGPGDGDHRGRGTVVPRPR